MGNIISSFASGFGKVIGHLFGSPLGFLAGKSCSTVCGSTWDFICYIENFCVANLLKMATILVLVYIVLLFLYLLNKMGICHCICKLIWRCVSSWFSLLECFCIFVCDKLVMPESNKTHHGRSFKELEFSKSGGGYDDLHSTIDVSMSLPRGRRDCRRVHSIRKSLRPRSHRVRVGLSRDFEGRNSMKHENHVSAIRSIRVNRTSRFARKGTKRHRGEAYLMRGRQ